MFEFQLTFRVGDHLDRVDESDVSQLAARMHDIFKSCKVTGWRDREVDLAIRLDLPIIVADDARRLDVLLELIRGRIDGFDIKKIHFVDYVHHVLLATWSGASERVETLVIRGLVEGYKAAMKEPKPVLALR